jgi:hypothetical protein
MPRGLQARPFARTVTFMDNRQHDNDAINKEMRNIIEEARVILAGIQMLRWPAA